MALDYNGSTQYTDLPVIDFAPGTVQMSMFCWMFADAIADVRLFAKAVGAASVGAAWWLTGIDASGQKSRLKTAGVTTTLAGGGIFATGVWIHTGFTYHSAGAGGAGWIGYKDGAVLLTAAGKSGTIDINPIADVWIGGNPPVTDRQFDGRMDDVRLYNRALSAAEMQTVFAARGTDGIVDGLISRWLLNEQAPGVLAVGVGTNRDIGPAGNNGDPIASPPYIAGQLRFRRKVA